MKCKCCEDILKEIENLEVIEIENYLKSSSWRLEFELGLTKTWSLGDFGDHQILLPIDKTVRGFKSSFIVAIEKVAEVKGIYPRHLVDLIKELSQSNA